MLPVGLLDAAIQSWWTGESMSTVFDTGEVVATLGLHDRLRPTAHLQLLTYSTTKWSPLSQKQ